MRLTSDRTRSPSSSSAERVTAIDRSTVECTYEAMLPGMRSYVGAQRPTVVAKRCFAGEQLSVAPAQRSIAPTFAQCASAAARLIRYDIRKIERT
jgi:hypothetical protein